MISVPSPAAASDLLCFDDLQPLPEDGRRYELIDGALLVTPAPGRTHQRCVVRLLTLLVSACPPDLEVLPAPYDWCLARTTVLEPDLLVARRADLGEARLERPPVLAVEVLSPSTRRRDLGDKRSAYADGGLPHYWVVDPVVPAIIVFALDRGRLDETARASGVRRLQLRRPFPIAIVPSAVTCE